MRKRVLIGIAIIWGLFFVGALLSGFLHPPEKGVSIENFQRLHRGMTEKQVVRIIGRPPGITSPAPGGYEASWETDDYTLWIAFSPTADSGTLNEGGVPILHLRPAPPSLYQRVKVSLGIR